MPRTREEALEYSLRAHDFIWTQLAHTDFPSSPRNDLVFAYLAITLEHQRAICEIVKMNLVGSALSLLRPQVETMFRGLWVNLLASEAQVTDIAQNGAEPFLRPFRDMAGTLDTAYNAGGWLAGFIAAWSALNGYTHTGLEQLGRRFRADGNIAPSYPDEMISELLSTSGTVSIGMAVPIFRHVGFPDKAAALEDWLDKNGVKHP